MDLQQWTPHANAKLPVQAAKLLTKVAMHMNSRQRKPARLAEKVVRRAVNNG